MEFHRKAFFEEKFSAPKIAQQMPLFINNLFLGKPQGGAKRRTSAPLQGDFSRHLVFFKRNIRMKNCAALALCAVLATAAPAYAELTQNHTYIAYDNVKAAEQNVKADEYVRLTGHIVNEPSTDVYVLKDDTGSIKIYLPKDLVSPKSLKTDKLYEIIGHAYREPLSELRVDVDKITEK
jgi:uncharacterized protein YdeI (BOF family)